MDGRFDATKGDDDAAALDELRAFFRSFYGLWIAPMTGIGGLVLAVLGLFNLVPAAKGFEVCGILCIVTSAFLVWRGEYRKRPPTDHPLMIRAREAMFRVDTSALSDSQELALILLAASHETSDAGKHLPGLAKTSLVICENGVYRLSPTMKPYIEKWAIATVAKRLDKAKS